jgi:hypothetical protein
MRNAILSKKIFLKFVLQFLFLFFNFFLETQRYDSFLGLPALMGKSQTKEFMTIIDRVEKRLEGEVSVSSREGDLNEGGDASHSDL